MEFRHYIALLWRWWWLIVAGTVVAGICAFFVSRAQSPVYEATSVLLISEGQASSGTDFSSLQYSERLAQSYVKRLTNYDVLGQAIANLGIASDPDTLARKVRVSLLNNSQLIALSVQDSDPTVAAALANEIPVVFAERNRIMQLERYASSKGNLEQELAEVRQELSAVDEDLAAAQQNGTSPAMIERLSNQAFQLRETHTRLLQNFEEIRIAEANSLNNIIVDERARVPHAPIRPRTVTNTLLAAVVGGMLALGIVFLIEYLDDTVKDPDTVEQAVGLGVLGTITRLLGPQSENSLVMLTEPRSPAAEAYRQLRTNVQYVGVVRELKSILVTSANAGEGKSTTAANLALALAQAGHQTLLVDSDLRRPCLHRVFGLPNHGGLTNLLLNQDMDEAYFQETKMPGLRVLTSGPLPPYPAELIASERMAQLVDTLAGRADFVVFDSPPILAVTDAVLLSQYMDTTLLVVETGRTRTQMLGQSARQIVAVDSHIAGVLLNKVDNRRRGYHYYYDDSNSRYYHENNGKNAGRPKRTNRVLARLVTQAQFWK